MNLLRCFDFLLIGNGNFWKIGRGIVGKIEKKKAFGLEGRDFLRKIEAFDCFLGSLGRFLEDG
jgi:hypothetical protein